MPLFGNKFSPKKAPARKITNRLNANEGLSDLVVDNNIVQLKLGDQELVFENGEWILESGLLETVNKANRDMKRKIQELEEENKLLVIKYMILLNMLTQTTAESHIQERQIKKLKKQDKK